AHGTYMKCPKLWLWAVVRSAVACGNGFPADGSADLFTPENTGKYEIELIVAFIPLKQDVTGDA
ncbi:hypothetical protein O5264_28550, partial [Escherichia coli]|nr:hypothetical protein [Escherichia coli]